MKRSLQTSFAINLLFVGLSHADVFAYQKVKKPVQARSVTGTYKIIVEQAGSILGCGFGFNVEPDGTYVKTSGRPPHLPPP